MGCSYLHTRAILQISQTNAIKGSETRVLVFSEPFGFIRQLCREWALPGETRAKGWIIAQLSAPPVTGALGVIGLGGRASQYGSGSGREIVKMKWEEW